MDKISIPLTHLLEHAPSISWMLQLLIVAGVALFIHMLEIIAYRYLRPKLKERGHIWQVTLLNAIHRPIGVLIWILALTYALDVIRLSEIFHLALFSAVDSLRTILVTIVMIWALIRYSQLFEETLINLSAYRAEVDRTSVHAIGQLVRIVVIITGLILIIQALGIPLSGVLTFSGVGGLAAGFAAKDTLGNFFGGFMLYIDKPFKVGDWIRSPDKDIEGTVEHIGWRVTTIRNFDRRPMYVPNGILTSVTIENGSRMSNRRINTIIGLRYKDMEKIPAITTDIMAMLKKHHGIDHTQQYYANLVNLAASTLDIQLYAFTLATDLVEFRQITQEVLLQTLKIILQHGASCVSLSTTLDVPNPIRVIQEKFSDPAKN